VTEEVTGVDLVRAQIEIASGRSLDGCGLRRSAALPDRFAMQLRINAETMDSAGGAAPAAGTLTRYEVPAGPGVRVDGYGYTGYTPNPAFDSLLAKLIVTSRSPRYEDVLAKARRALAEFRIEGVETNIGLLQRLLSRPEVARNEHHTRFIEDNARVLLASPEGLPAGWGQAGEAAPEGVVPVTSPIHGRIVNINVEKGDAVAPGSIVTVIEAMKMEHVVVAETGG
jgi:pyruvate carboxylase